MKIKKGDNVIIITGKDRGKTGAVACALPQTDKVIVDGLNISKRHLKRGDKTGIVERAMPLHVSNVMLLDKNGKRTRQRQEKTASVETKAPAKKTKASSKK